MNKFIYLLLLVSSSIHADTLHIGDCDTIVECKYDLAGHCVGKVITITPGPQDCEIVVDGTETEVEE